MPVDLKQSGYECSLCLLNFPCLCPRGSAVDCFSSGMNPVVASQAILLIFHLIASELTIFDDVYSSWSQSTQSYACNFVRGAWCCNDESVILTRASTHQVREENAPAGQGQEVQLLDNALDDAKLQTLKEAQVHATWTFVLTRVVWQRFGKCRLQTLKEARVYGAEANALHNLVVQRIGRCIAPCTVRNSNHKQLRASRYCCATHWAYNSVRLYEKPRCVLRTPKHLTIL